MGVKVLILGENLIEQSSDFQEIVEEAAVVRMKEEDLKLLDWVIAL